MVWLGKAWMMSTPEEIIHQWYDRQPHPRAPTVKVGEYPVAAKLATVLKFGSGHASPQEVANFWREYQSMNQTLQAQNKLPYSPEEFTQVAKQVAVSSFAFHGRPPTMAEMTRLRDAHPKDIHSYYGALPDQHYPTVSAADMAKALHSAQPFANMIAGREPNKLDAVYLIHSGEHPSEYYKRLQGGNQDQSGGQSSVPGLGVAGGQPADQRAGDTGLAAGPPAPGGADGVPAR